MKLFHVGVAMAIAIFIVCTSFSIGKEDPFPLPSSKQVLQNRPFAPDYYWYYADDSYDGFYTESQVIAQLEDSLGVLVNTDPSGAVFVAAGYFNNDYPHTQWSMIDLFAHY